jgi:CRISPR/Cas system-associated protein Cas10 (large subunit of type III CRISPR-Cas system)
MSKAHRGSGVRELVKSGRGTCPVCKRSGIKTVYEYESDGKKIKICKTCKASIANGKMKEALAAL